MNLFVNTRSLEEIKEQFVNENKFFVLNFKSYWVSVMEISTLGEWIGSWQSIT